MTLLIYIFLLTVTFLLFIIEIDSMRTNEEVTIFRESFAKDRLDLETWDFVQLIVRWETRNWENSSEQFGITFLCRPFDLSRRTISMKHRSKFHPCSLGVYYFAREMYVQYINHFVLIYNQTEKMANGTTRLLKINPWSNDKW